MKATINLRALQALTFAASTEATRYYLCGVLVSAQPGRIEMVATNGNILAADSHENDGDLRGEWIIPTDAANKIKLGKRDSADATLEHVDGCRLRLSRDGQAVEFEAIDGYFPDWRRVVPRKTDGAPAQYDVTLLAALVKAAKHRGLSSPGKLSLAHNGLSPAIVSWGDSDTAPNFFAVVMPFRGYDARLPTWIDEKPAEPESASAAA